MIGAEKLLENIILSNQVYLSRRRLTCVKNACLILISLSNQIKNDVYNNCQREINWMYLSLLADGIKRIYVCYIVMLCALWNLCDRKKSKMVKWKLKNYFGSISIKWLYLFGVSTQVYLLQE